MSEILENIPVEMRWAISTQVLTGSLIGLHPIIGEMLGTKKWREITEMSSSEGGKMFLPMVKEMFSIPVEDAVGAANLATVAGTVMMGPEFTTEIVEANPERATLKITKCPFWERYKEQEVKPEFRVCDASHEAMCKAGFSAVNPKIACKLMKAMPRGDSYCEAVYEFKR